MRQLLTGFGVPAVGALPAAASNTGALFRRTTDNSLWWSDGANWNPVGPFAQHVIAQNMVIPAGTALVVPRYVEIAAGVTLEIAANADLEIT